MDHLRISRLFQNISVALLCALLLSVIFHQDLMLKYFQAPEGKVMAPLQSTRTQLGDNYFYYILSKKSLQRLNPFATEKQKEDRPFFHDLSGPEPVYASSLAIAGGMDAIAKSIPLPWNLQVTLSLILQLSLTFFALLMLYILLRGSYAPIPWLSMLLFGFLFTFFCQGALRAAYYGIPTVFFTTKPMSYYPDIMRLVSPQIYWAFGLGYLAIMARYITKPHWLTYLFILLLSLLSANISMAMNLTLIAGFCLWGAYQLTFQRRIDWSLIVIGLVLSAAFLYNRHLMQLFYETEIGQEIGIGIFKGLKVKFHYLLGVIFIPFIRSQLPQNARLRDMLTCMYIGALLIGFACDSVNLGSRLWLRGAGVYVWFLLLFACFQWCNSTFPDLITRSKKTMIGSISGPFAIALACYLALPVNTNEWYGFIEAEKAQLIEWLNENTTHDDIVLSADLEDAYLLPIYTPVQPYVPLFDYGTYPIDPLLQRYFHALKISNQTHRFGALLSFVKQDMIDVLRRHENRSEKRIDNGTYQEYAFFNGILYHPYTQSTHDIFDGLEQHMAFIARLRAAFEKAPETIDKEVDYVLINKNLNMRYDAPHEVMIDTGNYQILKPVQFLGMKPSVRIQ